jgi:hypothetical protein
MLEPSTHLALRARSVRAYVVRGVDAESVGEDLA